MRHYHHHYDYQSRPEDDTFSEEDTFDIDDVVEELEKLQDEMKATRNRRPNREARRAIEDYLEKKRHKVDNGDPFAEDSLDE